MVFLRQPVPVAIDSRLTATGRRRGWRRAGVGTVAITLGILETRRVVNLPVGIDHDALVPRQTADQFQPVIDAHNENRGRKRIGLYRVRTENGRALHALHR